MTYLPHFRNFNQFVTIIFTTLQQTQHSNRQIMQIQSFQTDKNSMQSTKLYLGKLKNAFYRRPPTSHNNTSFNINKHHQINYFSFGHNFIKNT